MCHSAVRNTKCQEFEFLVLPCFQLIREMLIFEERKSIFVSFINDVVFEEIIQNWEELFNYPGNREKSTFPSWSISYMNFLLFHHFPCFPQFSSISSSQLNWNHVERMNFNYSSVPIQHFFYFRKIKWEILF